MTARERAVAAARRRPPAVSAALVVALVAGSLANVTAGLSWAAGSLAAQAADGASHTLVDVGTIGRALAFVAVSSLLGAWFGACWLVPRSRVAHPSSEWESVTDELWQIGRAAAWLLLLATLVRGISTLAALADPAEPVTAEWLLTVLRATTWGRGWTGQCAVAMVALVAWRHGRRPAGLASLLAGAAAVAAAIADAMTGHGMAGEWAGAIGVSLHAVHLIGVGVWLGTLGIVALPVYMGDIAERRALAGPLFAAVTPLALAGGGLVVGAGVLMGIEYAGGLAMLRAAEDVYSRTLLVKAALAACILALGAWHWRRAVPSLGSEHAGSGFRRTLVAELVLALLVLLLSGILVALPAAGV